MAIPYKSPPDPPHRAFALQKYLLLHSQHDTLQKHLDQISTSPAASPTTSPITSPVQSSRSSSTNSTDSAQLLSASHQPSRPKRPALPNRRSSLPDLLPTESRLEAIEEDQDKLKDVNLQIKTTLTELLNCEGVRGNEKYRMWIQTRLMDAERELKNGKIRSCDRRRSIDANGMSSA